MDSKYSKEQIRKEFERIKEEMKKKRPKFVEKTHDSLHSSKLERLKKLDPNFSKEYANLSTEELQQKIRTLLRKKFATPKSFSEKSTNLEKTFPQPPSNPATHQDISQDTDPRPNYFIPTAKCKHEKTVINPDFPGSKVCTECGLVLKPDTSHQKGVAFISEKRHKMPHHKEIATDIHQKIQSDSTSGFNCVNPECPSLDLTTGKGTSMMKIAKTHTDKDGNIHEYFILQCPVCSHTDEDKSHTGYVMDHNIIGQVTHTSSKDELLAKLKEFDPQYDINQEKYKLLENDELEKQIIALEKAGIATKKYVPNIDKPIRRKTARQKSASAAMNVFGLDDDFDESSIEFDSDSDSDSEDEDENQTKLRKKILRLKQKAIALGLPGAGYGREKGTVDLNGVQKVLAEVKRLEAKLKPLKKVESERNKQALQIVMELHNLYSNKNKVSFREREKQELTKLSNLVGKSNIEDIELGKMDESGIDLNTIILPKTLIFAPKNNNKELLDFWEKGENDAYNSVISDLEGESLRKQAIYNEARNYVLESIKLLENLVNIIISLKNGIIPEIDLIRKEYFEKIIKNKNWVLYIIRKYVRDVRDLTRKRTKALGKLNNIDSKDAEKIWFEVLAKINKKLNTTQEIPQSLYPFRKLKSGKVVPRNAIQWTFWKEKITLVDPETGKVIEGGLKQIHTEGKPLKKLINNKCYLIQKRRPWVENFKSVLISPVEYNEKYKQFLLGKSHKELRMELKLAIQAYGEQSEITQRLRFMLDQLKAMNVFDETTCGKISDKWYHPSVFFWAAACDPKYPPSQKDDIYTIKWRAKKSGRIVIEKYHFYVGNLLKDGSCILQNEKIFTQEQNYMKQLHENIEEKYNKIKNMKIKILEDQYFTLKPGQISIIRNSVRKNILQVLDKVIQTKIVVEVKMDDGATAFKQLKSDPENARKANEIEEAIYITNPTVENYFKDIAKIVTLLDLNNYEIAQYAAVFRQRVQLGIYKTSELGFLTFEELFPIQYNDGKVKEIYNRDTELFVNKNIHRIYHFNFPTKKIYTATKNIMFTNLKKLKLPCSKDKLSYFENNLYDLYIYEDQGQLYCLSVRKLIENLDSGKPLINHYTGKSLKKEDIEIIKSIQLKQQEDKVELIDIVPENTDITEEEQAYYYNLGAQDAAKRQFRDVRNVKARTYYKKGYDLAKRNLDKLFDDDSQELEKDYTNEEIDEIMNRQKIEKKWHREELGIKSYEQANEDFDKYIDKLAQRGEESKSAADESDESDESDVGEGISDDVSGGWWRKCK